ncbi:hypothetical protein OKS68_02750 [Aeromonas veronii]|uniref:hypothetical protein n=1 Tax=Aeromonas veronii TaxID=654 RepID=UPI00226C78EC|nr:hypothetical protein [Aeromonas veronii]MCX9131393.1 hypothetical protein [Aeromonas veronii]
MSEVKKIILYAILPALIAGLFAVAPKIYDEISEPKAQLSYSIIQGPLLEVNGVFKSIASIQVENIGKKVLSNVEAHIKTRANIDAINLDKTTGLEPNISKSEDTIIRFNKMHPNDHFTLSLMLSSKDKIMNPEIALRSDEVLGSLSNKKREDSTQGSILSGFLAALSVFVMSIMIIVKSKSSSSFSMLNEKSHTLFYIAAKLGLSQLIDNVTVSNNELTYLRFSDLLFYLATHDNGKRNLAIKGLKALLLIDGMSTSSRRQIERHLKNLEGNLYNSEEINDICSMSKEINDPISLRNKIDIVIDKVNVV